MLARSSAYGLPTFRRVESRAHYPFVDASFLDDDLPVSVSMRCYAPLQPHDVSGSTIPALALVYTVRNLARAPVRVAVLAGWQPTLGLGGSPREAGTRSGVCCTVLPPADGVIRALFDGPPLRDAPVVDMRAHNARGSQAILASYPASNAEGSACSWNALERRPAWWDAFARDGAVAGAVDGAADGRLHPAACVAMRLELRPAEERQFAFVVAWHAPRTYDTAGDAWIPAYGQRFRDADAVGRYVLADRRLIETLSGEWQAALGKSTLGAAKLPGMCAELEELAARALLSTPEADGARPELRFRLLGGIGDEPGALLGLHERARLQPCLLSTFPGLDANELATRLSHAADGAPTAPLGPPDKAALVVAAAQHFQATANAPWLSEVWPSLRRIGDALIEPDGRAEGDAVTHALASLVDLASATNDGATAARYQALGRPGAQGRASLAADDSAWLAWARALGCRMDARTGTLTIAPSAAGPNRKLGGPVFDPRFWGTMDIMEGPARTVVRFRLDRLTVGRWERGPGPGVPAAVSPFEGVRALELLGRAVEGITRAQVLLGADPLQASLERPGEGVLRVVLAVQAAIRPGDTIRLVLSRGPDRSRP